MPIEIIRGGDAGHTASWACPLCHTTAIWDPKGVTPDIVNLHSSSCPFIADPFFTPEKYGLIDIGGE